MTTTRRLFVSAMAASLGTSLLPLARPARAQAKVATLKILCGYPAGASVDLVSRKIGDKLTGRYAATAIVENKTGAAGRIAVQELKQGGTEGAMLLITPASVVTMYAHVFRNPGYDAFADLAPVSSVAQTAFALSAGPRVPASVTDLPSFAAWARSQRNPPQCGNAGAGSMPHFVAMLAAREMGFELQHIPFRGGSPAMAAAASGDLDVALASESAARSLVASGRLRVLGTTGADRSPFFRDARTFKDAGHPSLVFEEWFGAFMPARTSQAAVNLVSGIVAEAMRERDVTEAWDNLGLLPRSSTPAELLAMIRTEHAFWKKAVAELNFTPDA